MTRNFPSGVVCGETLYVPSHGITALRPGGSQAEPEVVWQMNRLSPSTASIDRVRKKHVYAREGVGFLWSPCACRIERQIGNSGTHPSVENLGNRFPGCFDAIPPRK
jgi:hypothetical protein